MAGLLLVGRINAWDVLAKAVSAEIKPKPHQRLDFLQKFAKSENTVCMNVRGKDRGGFARRMAPE